MNGGYGNPDITDFVATNHGGNWSKFKLNYVPCQRLFIASFKKNFPKFKDHLIHVVDCRDLRDPDDDTNLKDHCGSHPDLMARTLEHDHTPDKLYKIGKFCYENWESGRPILILTACTAGHHRSESVRHFVVASIKLAGGKIGTSAALTEPLWRDRGCKHGTCPKCSHKGIDLFDMHQEAYEMFRPCLLYTSDAADE